ncbi:MAG TPA: flagellar basal body-associated FliL family protein [Anaerolineaceae bacterium]|nr:flagellar basal body-associated FliL family protein [Anaerolineaceae bacterium]
METVLKILNIVGRVLLIVVLAATALLSISMAYIMFAPDEMPKPFRLVYQYPEESPKYLPPGVIPPANCIVPEPTLEPGEVEEVKPGEGVLVNMSTKIINLADPGGRKYIRLTVVLEFAPPPVPAGEETKAAHGEETDPTAEFQAGLNGYMPQMDDIVITLLSTKTYEQLYTAEGKEALRNEIMEEINGRIEAVDVISVYFTEFVVQ